MYKKNVEIALQYIKHNYRSIHSIQEISKGIGCNYNSLREIFVRETGITLNMYLNLIRCREAKKYLKCTDWILYRIALEVGFQNDKYFIKVFKKYNGKPPATYRRRAKV